MTGSISIGGTGVGPRLHDQDPLRGTLVDGPTFGVRISGHLGRGCRFAKDVVDLGPPCSSNPSL